MSKITTYPKLPVPGQPNYEHSLNRQLTDLFRAIASQLNGLSEGRITAKYAAMDNMPSAGSYKAGDYVEKKTKTQTGSAGSMYVVMGWIRLTDGANHVLNTDWVEDRRITGN